MMPGSKPNVIQSSWARKQLRCGRGLSTDDESRSAMQKPLSPILYRLSPTLVYISSQLHSDYSSPSSSSFALTTSSLTIKSTARTIHQHGLYVIRRLPSLSYLCDAHSLESYWTVCFTCQSLPREQNLNIHPCRLTLEFSRASKSWHSRMSDQGSFARQAYQKPD